MLFKILWTSILSQKMTSKITTYIQTSFIFEFLKLLQLFFGEILADLRVEKVISRPRSTFSKEFSSRFQIKAQCCGHIVLRFEPSEHIHLLKVFWGDFAHKIDPIFVLLPIFFQKLASILKRIAVVHGNLRHTVQNPITHRLDKVDPIFLPNLLHTVIVSHVDEHSSIDFAHSFIAKHKVDIKGCPLQFTHQIAIAAIFQSLNKTGDYLVVFVQHVRFDSILKQQKHGKVAREAYFPLCGQRFERVLVDIFLNKLLASGGGCHEKFLQDGSPLVQTWSCGTFERRSDNFLLDLLKPAHFGETASQFVAHEVNIDATHALIWKLEAGVRRLFETFFDLFALFRVNHLRKHRVVVIERIRTCKFFRGNNLVKLIVECNLLA